MVVSSLLTEAGFESAEKASVETLTEMLQSCKYQETTDCLLGVNQNLFGVLQSDSVSEDLGKRRM